MTGSYTGVSTLIADPARSDLELATATGLTPHGFVEHPCFFSGLVARPDMVAAGILAVADVASTRYFDLAALLASKDPVVTASGDRLRFESFSVCNGVYARFDLLSDGIDAGEVGVGTTNVDVNAPLRTALAGMPATQLLHLGVGADQLAVSTPEATHVERKVDLPQRWIRGFAEVPAISAGMRPVVEASGIEAMRFLVALPRSAPGPTVCVGRTARGLGIDPTGRAAASLAGTARLTALRRLMRFVQRLTVYDHDSGSSGWVVDLGGARLTLVLTAAPYRGFSGEGAQLSALAAARGDGDAARVLEHLAWQPVIVPEQLVAETGLDPARARSALAELGSSGRVGYDLSEGAWFHRDIPYDPDAADRDNPRLRAATELIADNAVVRDGPRWRVGNGEHRHWVVTEGPAGPSCTCVWFARYGGERGRCSHLLAVEMLRDR